MKQYIVTGMSCAACSARVEKAVNQLAGVESCSVSLLTNSMGVEGNVTPEDVIKAVIDAGYGASLKEIGAEQKKIDYSAQEELLKDKETPLLKKRLVTSLGFLVLLMYFSTRFLGACPLRNPFISTVEASFLKAEAFALFQESPSNVQVSSAFAFSIFLYSDISILL